MRRVRPNPDSNAPMHNKFNGHSTQSNPGLQDAMNAIWKKVDNELPAMDDIETISLQLSEDTQDNQSQDWIHGANMPVETTDYTVINSKARERRRMQIQAENKYETRYWSNVGHGDTEENIYSGFYENNCLAPNENLTVNHQANCFTIINKHYSMKSDSSSELENCDGVEVIPPDDLGRWYDRIDDRALEHTSDPEKRTIWIYSFKNKGNLLADTEYELLNIPNVSGSESSMELGEEAATYEKVPNAAATARAATPIPSSYVPRLDLSKGSTLPTVTEITEVKSDDDKSPKVCVTRKPKNSWFSNDITTSITTSHSDHKEQKHSEFRWVPLSARNRRRKIIFGEDLKAGGEKQSVIEGKPEKLADSILQNKRSISSQTNPVEIVDGNDNDIKARRMQRSATPTDSAERLEVNVEIHEVREEVVDSGGNERPKEEQIYLEKSAPEVSTAQLEPTAHIITAGETTPVTSNLLKTLHIKVSRNAKPIITETIENPDSDDWIRETRNECSKSNDNVHLQVDNAGTRLLLRNDLLLRPSRWDGYSAVVDSLPSLQITIGDSDSEHGDTWWRRVLNCVLCR